MKRVYRKKTWFYLCLFALFLLAVSGSFADEAQYFDCGTAAAAVGGVENLFSRRYGIAIYACKNPAPDDTTALPSWWDDIWFTGTRPGETCPDYKRLDSHFGSERAGFNG